MSEDRPAYTERVDLSTLLVGQNDAPPTAAEIAERLRQMSSDMMALGTDMQYVGGFGPIGKIGTAMHIGASNLRTWAHDIEEGKG